MVFIKWINNSKCSFISYRRRKIRIPFDNSIGGYKLQNISNARDLRVVLLNDLSFSEHINIIYNKAVRNFGFIKIN